MRFIHWLTGHKCRTRLGNEKQEGFYPAAALTVSLAPTRTRLTLEALEARDVPAANPIIAENLLPGNPQSEWDLVGGVGDSTIEGFATDLSVDQGQTVQFKINAPASAPYHIDIYRMGYYNGAGARKVATISSAQTLRQTQPAPLRDNATGLVDAGNWAVSASWAVPATAVSGIYFAKLVREDTGGANHILFVVRDDDGRADVLFQTADTTWQSYNKWGGASMYGGASNADGRAYKASYNRPFTTRTDTPFGRDYVFGPEFAMVRWLEANGYSTSYSTGIDTDRFGAELLEHKAFLSVGHDEYWSGAQRANVEAARDAGVNLMFLSGNELYWKIRWETSIDASGTPYRTMVCYKETSSGAPIDPSSEWTGTWRDPRWRLPGEENQLAENAVTGQLWTVNRGPGGETGTPFQVPYEYSDLRFWRNTTVADLQPGQTATLGDIVLGYEWDEDIDNGFRPAGLFRMSSTTQTVPERINDTYTSYTFGGGGANPNPKVISATATHSLTMYRAASGALVFGAGTVQWSYGLDGTHDGQQTTPVAAIRQATVNVLADMGVAAGTLQPGLVQATMSTDLARPTSTITAPTSGTFQVGVPVTITGTASDTGGGIVGGVEVSTDGGITWRRATGTTSWTYSWTPTKTGPTVIKSRVADDSGNVEVPGTGVTVNVVLGGSTSTNGLVAAYDFNSISGTTLQSAVSGTNGTISGGAAATTAGKFGTGALAFDGVDDIVTVADTNSLDLTTGMTLEAWVKPTAASSYGTILMKERGSDLAYSLYATGAASNAPPIAYIATSGGDQATGGGNLLPVNEWSHLTATFDGTTMALYVNGVLVSSRAESGPILTSTGALRIGGNQVFTGEYFKGVIDEVRVYNRALSQNEILSDMSTPVGGSRDSTAPTVSVASSGGSGTVTLTASTSDATGVAGVQFLLNGQPLGAEVTTGTGGTFTYAWNTAQYANGNYQISARARDAVGNSTTSLALAVATANTDATAPTVALTGLTPNTTVGGTLVLSAVASDTVGVVGVQFKANGVNLGSEVTLAPYRTVWDTSGLTSGTYSITAVARDSANNLTTSAAVSVTVDSVAPTVTGRTPAAGATGVLTSADPTVTFSESIQPGTLSFVLKDAAGNVRAATVTYSDATRTAVLHPLASLQASATYTLSVSGARDLVGNAMSSATTWAFTTASQLTDASVWPSSATPAVASASDASAVELGVKFRSSTAGFITGVRFYKGAGNTGTHVGKLWSSTGTLLASATFTSETGTGWQQVNFSTPVAIAANTTYVASYYAPNGGYAVDSGYFATAVNSSPLRALADGEDGQNGLYKYGAGGGFPDGSFNSSNYWVDVVYSSSTQDTAPPAIAARTPAPGATELPTGTAVSVVFSEPIQATALSFVLKTSSGSTVPAAVTYNDATLTATLTPTSALASGAAYTVEVSGMTDAAGNTSSGTASWSFSTAAQAANATSVWPSSATPAVASASDASAVELGVKFRSSTAGFITGVRFYKGAGNTGTHVGKLWSPTGTLLASATFTGETNTGWQQVNFSTPVAIAANTTYVASYYAPNGGYAVNVNYFASAGATNGNLQLLASGVDGQNGLYAYGSGGFPTNSYNSANYWVDVVYSADASDTTPPALAARTPAAGATAVPVSSAVTATFTESVTAGSVVFALKDAANNTVSATLTYVDATRTATLTPTIALAANTTYTASVSASDAAGNAMQAVSWSFTTPTPATDTSLWSASAVPQTASASDTSAVELGVRFFSEVSGFITGVRFYKGAGNTGTHVGKLWSSTGTLLASATFTSETGTGWQQVNFSTPVAIAANTTYVASYYAPNGGYAYTGAAFASGAVTNGYLHAPQSNANAGNGLYAYGSGGFPTNSYNSNNYWVDVVFSQNTSDSTAPTVTARTPATGSVGVLPNTTISVTFSEAIDPATVSFVLTDAFNGTVTGNLNYDATTHVATFVPSTPLLSFMTYTATVSGAKDLSGNAMSADSTWTFRTRGIWVQTSAADFGTGTNDGTAVVNGSGGEVTLAPLLSETFSGSTLSTTGWSVSSWGGSVTTAVSNGALSLGGAGVFSTASYANTAVEGRINFGGQPYQHFGLATGLDSVAGNYWALFSSMGTADRLFARVNANGSTSDVELGALPAGFHTYFIKPVNTGFEFYVDGTLRTTIAASFQTSVSMKAALSDYLNGSGQLLEVDSVTFLSFSTTQTGTFTSTQFDTGGTATLSTINYTANVPSGTSLTVRVRVGSIVNGVLVWTGWAAVTNGSVPTDANGNALVGQYIQYAVDMSTTNSALSPRFDDISISWV